MFIEYQALVQKLNEVAFVPQKLKYQFDELRGQLAKEIAEVRRTTESKVKEVDSYIQAFHHEVSFMSETKRRDKTDTVLEVSILQKKL